MAFYFCFAAQILRGNCRNPGTIPVALRVQGTTTPTGRNFAFYNPVPETVKLPALRAEVAEPGRLRPRLFLLLFFTPALRLVLASAAPRIFAESGPDTPRKLPWGSYPTQPFKQPHSGSQGQPAGKLLALPFSLYYVLVFDMPILRIVAS